ncbi:MAG: AMMECR1 domain-containing protein [bacterium]
MASPVSANSQPRKGLALVAICTILAALACQKAFPSGAFQAFSNAPRAALEKNALHLARMSLKACLERRPSPEVPRDLPSFFQKPSGAFVTITCHGRPRGCMGTLTPTTASLAQEILKAAAMAVRSDRRVAPLLPSEWEALDVCVTIPGPLKRVHSTAGLSPARLGLLVRCGFRSALLLPGEALSPRWQVDECFRKAGIKKGSRVEMFVFPAVTLGKPPEKREETADEK